MLLGAISGAVSGAIGGTTASSRVGLVAGIVGGILFGIISNLNLLSASWLAMALYSVLLGVPAAVAGYKGGRIGRQLSSD
jgi:uncharacterized membrane protein (UPF0136 family)